MSDSTPGPQGAGRPKTWDELDDKLKIEHLKGNIRSLANAVVQLDKLVAKLLQHNHVDGRINIPFGNPNHEAGDSVIRLSYELRHPERG